MITAPGGFLESVLGAIPYSRRIASLAQQIMAGILPDCRTGDFLARSSPRNLRQASAAALPAPAAWAGPGAPFKRPGAHPPHLGCNAANGAAPAVFAGTTAAGPRDRPRRAR